MPKVPWSSAKVLITGVRATPGWAYLMTDPATVFQDVHSLLSWSPDATAATTVTTVILEGHRGRGVGKALLAAAEKIAQARGVAVLLAVIFAPNDDAARLYTSAGFGPHGMLLAKELAR